MSSLSMRAIVVSALGVGALITLMLIEATQQEVTKPVIHVAKVGPDGKIKTQQEIPVIYKTSNSGIAAPEINLSDVHDKSSSLLLWADWDKDTPSSVGIAHQQKSTSDDSAESAAVQQMYILVNAFSQLVNVKTTDGCFKAESAERPNVNGYNINLAVRFTSLPTCKS